MFRVSFILIHFLSALPSHSFLLRVNPPDQCSTPECHTCDHAEPSLPCLHFTNCYINPLLY